MEGRRRERVVRGEYLERHRERIEGRGEDKLGEVGGREKSVGEDRFWEGGEGAEVTEVESSYKLE